jgi:hypothetical protein
MTTTPADVEAVLAAVPDAQRRADAATLIAMMGSVTGEPPVLWPASIIGFGTYHYRYATGREGDTPLAGFSPRKPHLVIYFARGIDGGLQDELRRLGRHTAGKGCLYIKRLADVDLDVLRSMIEMSVRDARASAPG